MRGSYFFDTNNSYFTNLRYGEEGRGVGCWYAHRMVTKSDLYIIQVEVNIPYRADRILIVSLKGGAGHQIHGGKT